MMHYVAYLIPNMLLLFPFGTMKHGGGGGCRRRPPSVSATIRHYTREGLCPFVLVLADKRRWTNAGLMLAHRLRRCANISPALVNHVVFDVVIRERVSLVWHTGRVIIPVWHTGCVIITFIIVLSSHRHKHCWPWMTLSDLEVRLHHLASTSESVRPFPGSV